MFCCVLLCCLCWSIGSRIKLIWRVIKSMICYKMMKKLLKNLKEISGGMVRSLMCSGNWFSSQEKVTRIASNYLSKYSKSNVINLSQKAEEVLKWPTLKIFLNFKIYLSTFSAICYSLVTIPYLFWDCYKTKTLKDKYLLIRLNCLSIELIKINKS